MFLYKAVFRVEMTKKLLFLCSLGQQRAPTAASLFKEEGYETKFAGVFSALPEKLKEMIGWADLIFVMEDEHQVELERKYGPEIQNKKIICLHIDNIYQLNDPTLKELVKKKVEESL